MNKEEFELTQLINEKRQEAGLDPLIIDVRLGRSATQKNEVMIINAFSDTQLNKSGFLGIIRNNTGGDYHRFGELVSMGYTPDRVLGNYVKCSGENKYIFDPHYTHMGIAMLNYLPKVKIATTHFAGKN